MLSIAVAADPTGKVGPFLCAANAESNNVSIYQVNFDGTLTPKGTIAAGTAPSALAVDPGGAFVYVANFGSNDVSAFAIAADGSLTSRGRIASGSGPLSVAVAPDPTGRFGRFLYVATVGSKVDAAPSTISMYGIDRSIGVLTALAPPVNAGQAPRAVSVHPSGRYVYVANGGYHWGSYTGTTVEAYAVNPNSGALTALPVGVTVDARYPLSSITAPTSIVFDPSGRFAILASGHGGSAFKVDATSGALAITGWLTNTGLNVTAAAVDPFGRFAYAASASNRFQSSNNTDLISESIIGADGIFTPAASLSGLAGSSPTSIAIDPSGKFAYVANSGSKNISVYSINATNGTLTLIATTPAY